MYVLRLFVPVMLIFLFSDHSGCELVSKALYCPVHLLII